MFYVWIIQNKFCSIYNNNSILDEILNFFQKSLLKSVCWYFLIILHITKETFSEEMKTENEPKYEGEQVTVSLSAMIQWKAQIIVIYEKDKKKFTNIIHI